MTCTYASDFTSTSTADSAWSSWNTDYHTTGGTTSTSGNNTVWYTWSDTYQASTTYTTTSTSDDTWDSWNDTYESECIVCEDATPINIPAPSVQRYKEFEEKRKKAEAKAVELLEVLLGKEQTKIYIETGRVFLKGKKFDYHIVKQDGFNIRKIEKDKVTDLCIHLRNKSECPPTDNVVALLLALQDDEDGVLEMANDHGESDDKYDALPMAAVAGG